MTGTRPYDAEALKREKPPIATMFATRCSDRIRVRTVAWRGCHVT